MSDDLRVLATNPPSNQLRVQLVGDEYLTIDSPPGTLTPRIDLVVFRGLRAYVIEGGGITAPWTQLVVDDVVLASVARPALTTCIPQSAITDRRTWR